MFYGRIPRQGIHADKVSASLIQLIRSSIFAGSGYGMSVVTAAKYTAKLIKTQVRNLSLSLKVNEPLELVGIDLIDKSAAGVAKCIKTFSCRCVVYSNKILKYVKLANEKQKREFNGRELFGISCGCIQNRGLVM